MSASAQAELAYVLAGAGCRPRSKWPTWREGGEGDARPLSLRLQQPTEGCDTLRPLRHCAWQRVATVTQQRLDDGAGPSEQQTQEARVAGEALRRLGQQAEETSAGIDAQ